MKVLLLSSNAQLEEKEIENKLEVLQGIVGGYIEMPLLSNTWKNNLITPIINEEGKFIDGLEPTLAVIDKSSNSIIDIVYGNCIFASYDKDGETIALNDEQINIIKDTLKVEVMLTDGNGKNTLVKGLFI